MAMEIENESMKFILNQPQLGKQNTLEKSK
jgi:hypothetical protein